MVTGAAGFVGGELARSLVRSGQSVRALLRQSSDSQALDALGVEVVRGELTDPQCLAAAVRDCDHVYHQAAMIRDRDTTRNDYIAINVTATESLLRAAAASGAKHFVYSSTTGIYGFVRETPLTEKTRVKPNSYYHESKYLAEQAVLRAGDETGLPVTIARLPSVIGVGKKGWEQFVRALSTPGFRCVGSGENHIHMGTVADVARGLRLCAERKTTAGRIFMLAGPAPITVNRMIEIMAEEIGARTKVPHLPDWPYRILYRFGESTYRWTKRPIHLIQRYSLYLSDKIIDTSKARDELGFQPQDDVEQAIRETVRWYVNEKLV